MGIASSNRLRGVVLHDVLSSVVCPEDLEPAVSNAVSTGEITPGEAEEIRHLLLRRMEEVKDEGWFPSDREKVLNEVSIIDSDGQVYRPDRVVRNEDKVMIIDYKFGEHYRKYEHQMKKYADLWRRMGYRDVTAYLWYVHSGEVVPIA